MDLMDSMPMMQGPLGQRSRNMDGGPDVQQNRTDGSHKNSKEHEHLLISFAWLLSVGLHGQQLKKLHEEPERFISDPNDYLLSLSQDDGHSESHSSVFGTSFCRNGESQRQDLTAAVTTCCASVSRITLMGFALSQFTGSFDQEGEEVLSSWLAYLKQFSGSSPKGARQNTSTLVC